MTCLVIQLPNSLSHPGLVLLMVFLPPTCGIPTPCLSFFDPLLIVYQTRCLWYCDPLFMVYRTPFVYFDPLPDYPWYIETLPMVFWPPTYGIKKKPVYCITMVYWILAYGILNPLSMVYWATCPWYFEPPPCGIFSPLTMVYWIPCLVFWPLS